jgi:hypothetical protein
MKSRKRKKDFGDFRKRKKALAACVTITFNVEVVVMTESTTLSGMKAIVEFCSAIGLARTESTVIQLKNQCGFPMRKLGGIWASDKNAITEWHHDYVIAETGVPQAAPSRRNKDRKRL